ncbi:MAG: hypothetical protein HETSPECPRED_001398 [Heterodermia speciosa]|uniref:Uncharacterized protein n=1 Tax=Heterodermia speciosa TaxID=116794 RepID=A0A8H3J185_9LECA|nr:MAG: hypothetical protein HETSPECPRED_001398 [Heterodermia speciosa]
MDFLKDLGERYLERKAYAAPQQFENLAKKEFKAAIGQKKPAFNTTTTTRSKDHEIATLRKQLAEANGKSRPLPTPNPHAPRTTSVKPPAVSDSTRSRTASSQPTESAQPNQSERRLSAAGPEAAAHRYSGSEYSRQHQKSIVDSSSPHENTEKLAVSERRPSHHDVRNAEPVQVVVNSSCKTRAKESRKPRSYAVEVEEEALKGRGVSRKDIIEVTSDYGRTVYRVRSKS